MSTLFLMRFNNDEASFLVREDDQEKAVTAFLAHLEPDCGPAMRAVAEEEGEDVRDLVVAIDLPEVAHGAVEHCPDVVLES